MNCSRLGIPRERAPRTTLKLLNKSFLFFLGSREACHLKVIFSDGLHGSLCWLHPVLPVEDGTPGPLKFQGVEGQGADDGEHLWREDYDQETWEGIQRCRRKL